MPDKRTPLVTGEYYHIFNRGVASQPTFLTKSDYEQAVLGLTYYQLIKPPLRLSFFKNLSIKKRHYLLDLIPTTEDKHIKIICFALMPNHFHLLLKQTAENGISRFISKFTNSYTKYFNKSHERVGPVFQGVFKSVHVESQEQLIHLSRYIHLNPVVSYVIKETELFTYPWSSLPEYTNKSQLASWPKAVLENFKTVLDYKNFLLDHVSYGKKLEEIKHLTLESL